MRQRKRRSEVEGIADPRQVVGGVDPATGVDSIDVLAAVERLDPDDRALLVLRYVLGYDATELSIAIGLSPPGTRRRLQRILQHLRRDIA